ncbi:MAG: response regulator [Nannocystaceae bacterium]
MALATSALLGGVAVTQWGAWTAVAGGAVLLYAAASLLLRRRPREARLLLVAVAVASGIAAILVAPLLATVWVSLAVATVMVMIPGWGGRVLALLLAAAAVVILPFDVHMALVGIAAIAAEATHRTFAEAAEVTLRARELQRLAGDASIANKEFLATFSHELRTPMSGVLGIVDALLARCGDRSTRHELKTVRSSAESALEIIEELLEFSRISGGQMTDVHAGFALRELIFEVIEGFRPVAEKKGLKIGALISVGLPEQIHSDPRRIERVLFFLVHNAVKFTARGRVEVVVESVSRGGQTILRLSVRDTGIGVSKAAQMRIFEPFVKADPETGQRFGGAGLGLTIAKRIVEEMDGSIEVESVVGEGSSFVVELPVDFILGLSGASRRPRPKPAKAPAREALPVEAPEAIAAKLEESGARIDDSGAVYRAANGELGDALPGPGEAAIVVVDDEPLNILVTKTLLQELGYQAIGAQSGSACLEVLRQRRGAIDLIFMDCRMPDLDGYQTTRLIRTLLGERSRPRIVALTANAAKNEEKRCRAAGMDDYLNKPARLEALSEMLTRWLPPELQRTGRRAIQAAPPPEPPAGAGAQGDAPADVTPAGALTDVTPQADAQALTEGEAQADAATAAAGADARVDDCVEAQPSAVTTSDPCPEQALCERCPSSHTA